MEAAMESADVMADMFTSPESSDDEEEMDTVSIKQDRLQSKIVEITAFLVWLFYTSLHVKVF